MVTQGSAEVFRNLRWHTIGVGVVLLVFVEYGGFFIHRTSFDIDGVRTFSLFDDAMISMRYGKNMADGDGLVWNPGEARVEGYTNFLWTLVMAVVHLLPIGVSKISLVMQILSLALLTVNLLLVRKLALLVSGGSHGAALASMVLTGFYFPLNNWALQGMEVGLLTMLVTAIVLVLVQSDGRIPATWSSAALLTAAVLTRADAPVLLLGLIASGWFWSRTDDRTLPWKPVALVLGVFALHSVFRLVYYGDMFPNTYHLKVAGIPAGVRMARGVETVWEFATESSLFLMLLPLLLLVLSPQKRQVIMVMGGAVVVQMFYSVYVGGDAWEWYGGANRYVAVIMPVFFILLGWTVHEILGRLRNDCVIRWRTRAVDIRPALFAMVTVFALYAFNGMHWVSLTLQVPPLEVHNNERMVRSAYLIREATFPGARVAVAWAGILPYFSGRTGVDLLGKNDRHVARLPANAEMEFVPGHNKWDYHYSIRANPPDVVAQLWKQAEEILPFVEKEYASILQDDGRFVYFRKESPLVKHDLLDTLNMGIAKGATHGIIER